MHKLKVFKTLFNQEACQFFLNMSIRDQFCFQHINNLKSNLNYTCSISLSVQRVCGDHLHVIEPEQHSSFQRNVTTVESP